MNNTIIKFLQANNIDINSDKINDVLQDNIAINDILLRYRIELNEQNTQISLANVLGDTSDVQSLSLGHFAEKMCTFFDEAGNGYEKRSLGMLDYTSDNVVDCLRPSFASQPIYLNECGDSTYYVGQNGKHRIHLLKFHYLKELANIDKTNLFAMERLNQKYTIDCVIKPIDYIKTYCFYILDKTKTSERLSIESELDTNYMRTGRSKVVELSDNVKSETIVSDDELIRMAEHSLLQYIEREINSQGKEDFVNWDYTEPFTQRILREMGEIETFKSFMVTYMPDCVAKLEEISSKKNKQKIDFTVDDFFK